MKAFKLKEEKSFIKVLKEPPAAKKKTNWSRLIYIGIFSVVGIMVLTKVSKAYLLISADGQLELPKQNISFPDDIEIIKYFVEEGQTVEKGDTLFQYRVSVDTEQLNSLVSSSSSKDWILKDKIATNRNLELAKIKLLNSQNELQLLRQRLSAREELVILGINEEYENFKSLQIEVQEQENTCSAFKKEIELYGYQLSALKAQEKKFKEDESQRLNLFTEIKYFISIRTGTISDIFYEVNEICYKKEELMTLHKQQGASITTYFDPIEINHLKEGDLVDIEFPDGTESKGIIRKLLISTYALPSEFQKKYEPTERNIVAEVSPLAKTDEALWNNFYKMDVKIKKFRYDWF